jgi:hypothetical protein
VKSLRNWLERHKIYFETLAASLLSLMALAVTVAQTATAIQQTGLLRVQTSIAEAQALPRFDVSLHQQLNEPTRTFDNNILEVSNGGGPVRDFDASAALLLVVTLNTGTPPAQDAKAEIPVSGYFTANFLSGASVGSLVRMIGDRNNARVADLARELRESAQAKHWAYGLIEEQLILRLQYRDLLDRTHDDYYRVEVIGGGRRIARDEGERLFKKWQSGQRIELNRLTPDVLTQLTLDGKS